MSITAPRPKVAFLTHSAALSGAELFIARVTARHRSIDPVVILGERGPLEGVLAAAGVPCEVVPLGHDVTDHGTEDGGGLVRKTWATIRATRSLRRRLLELDVDIVTTHSAKAHVYGGLATRAAHRPLVAHVHDMVQGSRLNRALLQSALRWLPDHVVANSEATRTSLRSAGRAADVVPCPAVMRAVPLPPDDGGIVVTMVGRITAWKGQDIAVRAFAIALEHGLPTGSTLRIVGDAHFGEDARYGEQLRALVLSLGIADSVVFTGHVDDVAAELGHVLVHASRRPEPFGQVIVEGMAAGRAVIATRGGGPSEIITDGHDGLLVPAEDVDALAAALVRLGADAPTRHRISTNARRTAERYDPTAVVAELERAYARAC